MSACKGAAAGRCPKPRLGRQYPGLDSCPHVHSLRLDLRRRDGHLHPRCHLYSRPATASRRGPLWLRLLRSLHGRGPLCVLRLQDDALLLVSPSHAFLLFPCGAYQTSHPRRKRCRNADWRNHQRECKIHQKLHEIDLRIAMTRPKRPPEGLCTGCKTTVGESRRLAMCKDCGYQVCDSCESHHSRGTSQSVVHVPEARPPHPLLHSRIVTFLPRRSPSRNWRRSLPSLRPRLSVTRPVFPVANLVLFLLRHPRCPIRASLSPPLVCKQGRATARTRTSASPTARWSPAGSTPTAAAANTRATATRTRTRSGRGRTRARCTRPPLARATPVGR